METEFKVCYLVALLVQNQMKFNAQCNLAFTLRRLRFAIEKVDDFAGTLHIINEVL